MLIKKNFIFEFCFKKQKKNMKLYATYNLVYHRNSIEIWTYYSIVPITFDNILLKLSLNIQNYTPTI